MNGNAINKSFDKFIRYRNRNRNDTFKCLQLYTSCIVRTQNQTEHSTKLKGGHHPPSFFRMHRTKYNCTKMLLLWLLLTSTTMHIINVKLQSLPPLCADAMICRHIFSSRSHFSKIAGTLEAKAKAKQKRCIRKMKVKC